MNSNLANQLLASIMNWDPKSLAAERAALEFMGRMKYDAYDRYMPGMRFMSSLVQWLNDIDEEDRNIAFKFVKEQLVFISSTQMNYLVDLLYDSKIRSILLNTATKELGMASYMHSNNKVRKQFEIEKRCSLVVGLSDGAHIDILRRSAHFNNEQVLTNYYPDSKKLKDMLDALHHDGSLPNASDLFFKRIFLIDDFTASGKSFIRYDNNDKRFHGKLKKIIDELCAESDTNTEQEKQHLNYLFNPKNKEINIDILFCIATERAKCHIEENLQMYLESIKSKKKIQCVVHVHIVQLLENRLSDKIKEDTELMRMLEKPNYFIKESIMTKSYAVGKSEYPWLGFDECALPVVLSHNTPNNSLPIIWQEAEMFHGLFPRISRH